MEAYIKHEFQNQNELWYKSLFWNRKRTWSTWLLNDRMSHDSEG